MKVAFLLLAMMAVAYAVEPEVAAEEPKCGCEEKPKCEKPEVSFPLKWKLAHFESYEKGAHGWSNNAVSECDCRSLLGGFNKFAGGEVHKTVEELPAHSHIRIKANYYFIDDWEKETAFAKIDDKVVWTQYSTDSSWRGVNVCGKPDSADRINALVDVSVPHDDACAKITFGSNLQKGASDSSFGISSLAVYVGVYEKPKPKCGEKEE